MEDNNYSWNCGDGAGVYGIRNNNTIAIEMCCNSNGEISATTEANTVELVRHLMQKYNIPLERVVRHYDASRKICPNWSDNNWSRWTSFKNKLKEDSNRYKLEVDSMGNRKFSWYYYLKKNPDLEKAGLKTEESLYKHYIDFGKKEGRKPLPDIPSTVTNAGILYNRKDVAKVVDKGQYPTALDWWLLFGWAEGSNYTVPTEEELLKKYGISKCEGKEDASNKETFYRVVTGSYKDRENAEKKKDELTNAGFESFLDVYKK